MANLAHGLGETDEDRPTDDRVSDVEFLDLPDGGDRPDVAHGEPVTRVHGQSESAAEHGTACECGQGAWIVRVMGVASGVEFDGVGAEFGGAGDGVRFGIDEQTAAHAGASQARDGLGQKCDVLADGQSSFCRDFFAPFGYESHLLRTQPFGEEEHRLGGRALEIERRAALGGEAFDVEVLDVASVLAQVRGDAVGAGVLAEAGRVHRVGLVAASGLPQGGHVVDVHKEPQQRRIAIAGGPGVRYVRVGGRGRDGLVTHAGNAAKEEAVRKRGMLVGIWLVAIVASACSRAGGAPASAPMPNAGSAGGAASSRDAVDAFMTAVRAQDLQTMSAVWGTARGPARDQLDREQLEKRLVIIQCKLDHDSWSYAEERPRLLAGGKQDFRVRLKQKSAEAVTSFTTILAADGRWYVEIVDLEPLRDFCR